MKPHLFKFKNLSSEAKVALNIKQGSSSEEFSINENTAESVSARIYFEKRGVYENTRIRVYSRYPLGLFYCWRSFNLKKNIYVYPSPKSYKINSLEDFTSGSNSALTKYTRVGDEYSELKGYEDGDPVSRIDWKRLAKNDEVLVKINDRNGKSVKHIDWSSIFADDFETKLSYISFLILYFSKEDYQFKLTLPGFISKVGQGEEHTDNLLKKLASLKEVEVNEGI